MNICIEIMIDANKSLKFMKLNTKEAGKEPAFRVKNLTINGYKTVF
jgi:hypothetical protein